MLPFERRAETLDRARVQLRNPRLVHPQLRPDLLHRHFGEVVEADQLALALRQRRDGRTHTVLDLSALVGGIGRIGLGGHERGGKGRLVEVIARGERGGGLDRVDADDRAAEALLVGTDTGREIGERGFVAQLAAKRFARGLELAPLPPHAARPRLPAQGVDHRAAHAALGEGLELDAAILVEPVRGIDQAQYPVLHEITEVDRVGHRRRQASGKRLDEREACNDASALAGGKRLDLHLVSSGARRGLRSPHLLSG